MFVKRGICGLVLKVPFFIVMDIGCKCNTIEISMQNVYLPTQTIFVLRKSLYINGELFE